VSSFANRFCLNLRFCVGTLDNERATRSHSLKSRLRKAEETIRDHEERIESTEERLDAVDVVLADHEERIDELERVTNPIDVVEIVSGSGTW
jgi:chromosome segregation ATPase